MSGWTRCAEACGHSCLEASYTGGPAAVLDCKPALSKPCGSLGAITLQNADKPVVQANTNVRVCHCLVWRMRLALGLTQPCSCGNPQRHAGALLLQATLCGSMRPDQGPESFVELVQVLRSSAAACTGAGGGGRTGCASPPPVP